MHSGQWWQQHGATCPTVWSVQYEVGSTEYGVPGQAGWWLLGTL